MLSPRPLLGVLAGVASFVLVASPARSLRVVDYNILNYSSGRTAQFRLVLEGTDPDVVVVEEILSQAAVNTFLADVLNAIQPGEWAAGEFVDGPDTDSAIFYRIAAVQYIDHFVIGTSLRNINEWTFRPAGYASDAANVRVYVVHLKASDTTADAQQRLQEVMLMRQRMETFPPGQNYIVTGDFNIYRSSEPAYQYLLSTTPGPAGVVVDPINAPGDWHDNAVFAAIHTQSPRTTQFGGGANGGMDDRFDMMLVGPSSMNEEGFDCLEETYTPYGNDGLHFNLAIISPPVNQAVSPEMAQALHDASDHLPVFADFQVPPVLVAGAALDLGVSIVGGLPTAVLSVENGASAPADELDYSLAAPAGFGAPAGPFTAAALAGPNLHVVSMESSSAGLKSGDLVITSDAPDDPTHIVALSGIVLDHAEPSAGPDSIATLATLDFGEHAPGGFGDQTASIFNHGYDELQAILDVHDAELAGDPRFSIDGGFTPAMIGATPGTWSIHFDDAGAPDGTYLGTLTFHTRDQQDLIGAVTLADVLFDLVAVVSSGPIDVAPHPEPPLVAGLHEISPNPFRPRTSIGFGVTTSGPVRLVIYDVAGRRVRGLVDEALGRGAHHVSWDGRDDGGRDLGAGVFYARLETPQARQTRLVVRVR